VDLEAIRARVREALIKESYMRRAAAQTGRELPQGLSLRTPAQVLYRFASFRLDPSCHPVSEDSARRLIRAGVRALRADRHLSLLDRAFYASVLLIVAVGPRRAVTAAVEFTFLSRPRPAWMRRAAYALRRSAAITRRRRRIRTTGTA
jgi:hypothetical protein